MTRLYFHSATDNTSGLPTTEQSALSAFKSFEAQTVNHSMTTTIGTSQVAISNTTGSSSAVDLYITKFVSPPLDQTSIAANTWTYNFAARESSIGANWLVTSSAAGYVNCYVWRPSNQSLVGTIRDGTTGTITESNTSERVIHVTFTGSAVSSVQQGDVIIVEVWAQTDSSATGASATCDFFYDGTTENTTNNATVSNHASFLETPETLTFFTGTTYNRSPSAENITVSESSPVTAFARARVPSTDTTTISEQSLARLLSSSRIPSADTITISENSLDAAVIKSGIPLPDTTVISDSSLVRLLSSTRVPNAETNTISDSSLTRVLSSFRIPSAEDTITVSEQSLIASKVKSGVPSPDMIVISEISLDRMLSSSRLPSTDDITIADSSLLAVVSASRNPTIESESITDSSLIRLLSSTRVPATEDIGTIGETVTGLKNAGGGAQFDRTVNDTVILSEVSLTQALSLLRILSEVIDVSEVATPVSNTRSLIENNDTFDFSLNRGVLLARTLEIESVAVGESIFYTGGLPTGSMTYATPAEVRVLLGNLGGQRTDQQIELAINAAYDEINRRTNRIPPDDWKDTDADFDIIKKLTRYIAAKEMAIGIKDFDTSQMQVEIDKMYETVTEYGIGTSETDIVESNADSTYALNPEGIIWSTRYKNLKKGSSSGEGDTSINIDA